LTLTCSVNRGSLFLRSIPLKTMFIYVAIDLHISAEVDNRRITIDVNNLAGGSDTRCLSHRSLGFPDILVSPAGAGPPACQGHAAVQWSADSSTLGYARQRQ
jgi:hypothetical protein